MALPFSKTLAKSIIFKTALFIFIGAAILFLFVEESGKRFGSENESNGLVPENNLFYESDKFEKAVGEKSESAQTAADEVAETSDPKPKNQDVIGKDVLLEVPFTSQAPFGDWKNPRQQDGCEEASALMAMAWVKGEKLTQQKALKEIIAISDYELKTYGNFHDTDAEDTAERIFKGYFGYDKIEVRYGIGTQDIKTELLRGSLVIIPVDGRKLGNPYYTPPGPPEHNLVVRGYDAGRKEFITNDSGTRQGENYRYKESVIENALQDYPTGHREPITEKKTAMIVVKK